MTRTRSVAIRAAAFACAAIPAPLLHQALAAAAGTLFEAAPFVLALAVVRGPLVRRAAALFGCGCGAAAGPAALSLPAAALCWFAFGPAVALARLAAAAVLHASLGPRARNAAAEPDPLQQLGAIAVPAFGLALATAFVQASHPGPEFARLPGVVVALLEGAAGLLAGSVAPCCTAAIALAAMLRSTAPFTAAGMLLTAGLVPHWGRVAAQTVPRHDARFGLALVALACATLAVRGGSGFIHPRLVPLLWLTIPAALVAARTRPVSTAKLGALAPAAMLAALVLGSPPPVAPLGTGTLDGLYAGEAIDFTGVAVALNGRTALVRYAITCCRADATAVVLPTNLQLRLPPGTWLTLRGTIAREDAGYFAHAMTWRRVPAPADPYLYR
jgi:hypothetical protein